MVALQLYPICKRVTRLTIGLALAAALAACGGGGGGGGSGGSSASTTCGSCTATISNLRNKGVTQSGFVIGTAGGPGLTGVQVSLDGGAYSAATGTATWSFKLPTGGNTWRDGTPHTIAVQAVAGPLTSAPTTIAVRKGTNQDVNGDGYADVAVGSQYANSSAGAVYIFRSAGPGGAATCDLTAESPTCAANTTLGGAESSNFGFSVALADVNGDGYADVIVGVPFSGVSAQGRVYVFQSVGPSGVPDEDLSGLGTANTTLAGPLNSQFGQAVAAGDVNGDGYADVVVGAPDVNSDRGAVYVFHSSAGGVPDEDLSGTGTANTTLSGATSSQLGWSVAVGDVTGDGYADVVAGAESLNDGQGAAYVFHSHGGPGVPTCDLSSTCMANTTLLGPSISIFGWSVASADVNGDGYADVAVGALGLNSEDGAAYVFHSSASGIPDEDLSGAGTATTTLIGPAGAGGGFGWSVAAGDVNGDGGADLMVGAPNINSQYGAAYLFQSSGGSGVPNATCATVACAAANAAFSGTVSRAELGMAVGIADLNGDGYGDVMASAVNTCAIEPAPTTPGAYAYLFQSTGSTGVAGVSASGADGVLLVPSSSGGC